MAYVVRTKEYKDVTLRLEWDHFRGCCGAVSAFYFGVEGCTSDLSEEDIKLLYTDLAHKLFDDIKRKDNCKAIIVFSDVSPEHIEDEEAAWSNSEYRRDGDICMANFCRHMGCKESDVGMNGNTDNGVMFFTGLIINAEGDRVVYPAARFPDEEPQVGTVSASDRARVLQQLAALAGA